jgi:hypothetical protein
VVTAIFANLIGIPVAETITVIAFAMKALPIYVFLLSSSSVETKSLFFLSFRTFCSLTFRGDRSF